MSKRFVISIINPRIHQKEIFMTATLDETSLFNKKWKKITDFNGYDISTFITTTFSSFAEAEDFLQKNIDVHSRSIHVKFFITEYKIMVCPIEFNTNIYWYQKVEYTKHQPTFCEGVIIWWKHMFDWMKTMSICK